MDYFDKKINGLYNQPEQDVPNDLSWDHMEDGIYSRMDNKKSKRRALWYWISGGLVAIALIIGSVIMFSAEEKKSNFANNNSPVYSITKSSEINSKIVASPSLENSETATIQTEIKNAPEVKEKKVVAHNSTTKNKLASTKNKNNLKKNTVLLPSDVVVNTNNISDQSHSSANNIYSKNKSNHTNPIEQQSSAHIDATIAPAVRYRDAIKLNTIASVSLNLLTTEKILLDLKKIKIDDIPSEVENKQNTKYAFSLLGGTSLHSGYNIQSSDHTSILPGYSIRLGLSAEKESGWGYELGIGHALLVEKFDLDITDTISTHHEDIVVGRLINSLTGSTTDLIGDGYIDSSRSRRELVYNTINLFSVDAAIYRRINISSKWSITPSVGIQYDRILDIKGKSLDTAGEVFAYNNNILDINKNLLSANLGIGIDYSLSHMLSLSLRASTTYSLNNLYSDGKRLGTTYLQGGIKIRL